MENVLQSFKKILFSGRKYGKWSSIERDIKLYWTWTQHVFYQRLLVRIFISKWLLRCLFENFFLPDHDEMRNLQEHMNIIIKLQNVCSYNLKVEH